MDLIAGTLVMWKMVIGFGMWRGAVFFKTKWAWEELNVDAYKSEVISAARGETRIIRVVARLPSIVGGSWEMTSMLRCFTEHAFLFRTSQTMGVTTPKNTNLSIRASHTIAEALRRCAPPPNQCTVLNLRAIHHGWVTSICVP